MSKIAFLFPGQGAQFIGMGRRLLESHAPTRDLFQRAEAVLGYDLLEICLEGPADKLNSTIHSQPALFVTSLAALDLLRQESPETVAACSGAAGLSLGEYTAMVFAEAFDFETGLRLVQRRGEAMQAASDAVRSGMVSILGLDRDGVEALCSDNRGEGEILQIANLLCPQNIVISGHLSACERAAAAARDAGAMKAIQLAVAGAFHTPLMEPAVEKLREALGGSEIKSPRLPVLSNVDAQSHADPTEIQELLLRQVVTPVRWEDSMEKLLSEGFDSFYEVGPGKVLRGLLRRISRKIPCENIEC